MESDVNTNVNNNSVNMDPLGQLKQIKDIIFGPEMDDLLGRIQNLEKKLAQHERANSEELTNVKSHFDKSLETTQAIIEAKIEQAVSKLEAKTQHLDKTKVKRDELGKLLINLGEKFLKE